MASAAEKKKDDNEPKSSGRGIEETLHALGIEDDLPPEDAAQAAVSSINTADDVEEEDDLEEDEEPGDTEEESDDTSSDGGEEGGGKGEEVQFKIPPPTKPKPEKAKAKPRPKEGDFVPDDLPLPELNVAAPPPKPKAKARDRSPAAGKLGKGLAEKVPGAEKVKVYKRIQGQKHFVNAYTKGDLDQFPDFESFLVRYVKPEHGAGEYDLVGVDAYNRETQLGQIRLIESPRDNNKEAGAIHLVETMLQQQKEQNEKWLSRMKDSMTSQNQQNPLDLLTGVMTLQEKLNQKAEATKREAETGGASVLSSAMQAMSESSSQTMQMFMAMMQQQQATMTALLSKPKDEDPVTKLLLMKLLEDKKEESSGDAPPPPPPPQSPTQGLSEILTAMAGFMGAVGGGGGGDGDDEFKAFLQQMLLKQQQEGLSTKEMIQLLMQKDEKPGTDDFRRSIDNMAAIMNVANNLNRGQEGGPAAGLFDALAALFSNRDFAGSIAQTIRMKTDRGSTVDSLQAERQQIEAEKQRLAMQARIIQRAQLEAHAASQQGQGAMPGAQHGFQGAPGGPPGGPPTAPQAAAGVPQQVATQQPPQSPPSNPAQQAQAEQLAQSRGLPPLPANTHEHVNQLVMAKDDADLVGKIIEMLIYFAEFDEWKEFMEGLLGHIRDGNRPLAQQFLHAFFGGLAEIHMVDPSMAQRAVKMIDEHFETVQAQLEDLRLEKDEQITADDLLGGDEDDDYEEEDDEDDEDSDEG